MTHIKHHNEYWTVEDIYSEVSQTGEYLRAFNRMRFANMSLNEIWEEWHRISRRYSPL